MIKIKIPTFSWYSLLMTELVRARTDGMDTREFPRGVPPRKATRRRRATEEAAAKDVIVNVLLIDLFWSICSVHFSCFVVRRCA